MVDVMEYSTPNRYIVLLHRINKNCFQSVLEELGSKGFFPNYQSNTDIFFSNLLLLPSILSNDRQTNVELVELISKIILDPPELNCSVLFSLYCLRVSKKVDHFLRNLVRRERRFSWFNVDPLSFIGMMLGTSTGSLLCGFAFAVDRAAKSL